MKRHIELSACFLYPQLLQQFGILPLASLFLKSWKEANRILNQGPSQIS
jgi:hypothetical protein